MNLFDWKSSLGRRIASLIVAGLSAGVVSLDPLIACGPFFPNSILLQGDDAVLQAPQARFGSELDRLKWEAPRGLVAPEPSESLRQETVDTEILDLRRALGATLDPAPAPHQIAEWVLAFSRKRADLEEHRNAFVQRTPPAGVVENGAPSTSGSEVPPVFVLDLADLPAAIPREFRIYLEGAAAWHDDRREDARSAWERLLALPAKERRFKSTWAAYMIGQSWHHQEPERAADYYRRTRQLARDGFADSAGLAVASLGWEAQLKFLAKDYPGAMRLYLDQYAAGSTQTSAQSLGIVTEAVLAASPEIRLGIARDKTLRRVVTAWLLSRGTPQESMSDENPGPLAESDAVRWLETIEASGAGEVELAEQVALLAYQAAQWSLAERWIELSGESAVARWVRAKLRLREGRIQEAAGELAHVVRALPERTRPSADSDAPTLAESLFTGSDAIPAGCEVRGELGTICLSQGDFIQALDLLVRGGFWQDAAYVAERIVTVDELRSYVDRSWSGREPRRSKERPGESGEGQARGTEVSTAEGTGERLRHVLGRRLTRVNRGREATEYFPSIWRAEHQRLLNLLATGENEHLDAGDRARAWQAAAWLVRTNGMELIGTEVAPDWAIWGGDFEFGPTHEERRTMESRWLKPSAAEGLRASRHAADPEVRFHYRYHAALLAWNAAALLPDNDATTARILYDAGCWLKSRDPQTADLYYKALVQRCRGTELGDAADRQRWFPALDAVGKPLVTRVARTVAHAVEPATPESETSTAELAGENADSDEDETGSEATDRGDSEPLAPGPDLE